MGTRKCVLRPERMDGSTTQEGSPKSVSWNITRTKSHVLAFLPTLSFYHPEKDVNRKKERIRYFI
jgi:hypothetical protein